MDICSDREIGVRWCKRIHQSKAMYDFEEIVIAPIRSAISYAVALHEIGHILGRRQHSKSVLVRERFAWQWARGAARTWTPAMERRAMASYEWYIQNEAAR